MSKYLVTGGCGFIGSHLVKFLVKKGHAVSILDDLSNGKQENAPQEADLFIGSVTDSILLEEALEGVDGCFHLAAIPSVQRSIQKWMPTHQINLGGTISLFETVACLGKKIPIVYASSAAVYGDHSLPLLTEETHLNPLSPYGVDKMASEHHARLGWQLYGIPSIGFRFFNVYGPDQDPLSSYSGVITLFIKRMMEGKPLTFFGDGQQQRDFVFVSDVARILEKAMQQLEEGATIFNLCSGFSSSIHYLADLLEEIVGCKIERQYLPPKKGDILTSLGDPSKLKRLLNLQTEISLKEGLTQLLQIKLLPVL